MSLVAIALGSVLMSMLAPTAATAGYVSLADFDGCWAGTGDVTGLEVTAKLKVSPLVGHSQAVRGRKPFKDQRQ